MQSKMRASTIIKPAILIGFALLALMVLFQCRLTIAEQLVPLFRWATEAIENRLSIAEFGITRAHQEYLFHLRVVSSQPLTLYGGWLPGMDVSATTLVTYALQHLFLFSLVMVAGILYTAPSLWRILGLSVLALPASLLCDIPFMLLGSVEGLFLENLAPEQLHSHPLVLWSEALNGGARMALPLGLALLCLALAQRKRN